MTHCYSILLLLTLSLPLQSFRNQELPKNRLVVLTDIEADADDTQSMIRLLLYSNDIDIEGFVATTSVHQKGFIAPGSIYKITQTYGKVLANLRQHDAAYPAAEQLYTLVKKDCLFMACKV